MRTVTVNIAFKDDLLKKIDEVAKQESRSRSELIREAARMYIERKSRWEMIFDYGQKKAKENDLTEQDILDEIAKHRKEQRETKIKKTI